MVNSAINTVDYYTENELHQHRTLYNNIALTVIFVTVGFILYINRESIFDFLNSFTQNNLQAMGHMAINYLNHPNPIIRQVAP